MFCRGDVLQEYKMSVSTARVGFCMVTTMRVSIGGMWHGMGHVGKEALHQLNLLLLSPIITAQHETPVGSAADAAASLAPHACRRQSQPQPTAANALMHATLLHQQRRQQTMLLLHDLAHCYELNQLIARTAAQVLRAGSPNRHQQQQEQQQQDNGHPFPHICSVMTAFNGWNCFAWPSSSSRASQANSSNVAQLADISAADEPLLMSCLIWHQHQQMLLLMGLMPEAAGSSQHHQRQLAQKVTVEEVFWYQDSRQHNAAPGLQGSGNALAMSEGCAAGTCATVDLESQQQQQQHLDSPCANKQFEAASCAVFGLTAAQLLLVAQGDNAGLLSLLLLDSVRLPLMQQLQLQPQHRQPQPWQTLLFLLAEHGQSPQQQQLVQGSSDDLPGSAVSLSRVQ